MCEFITGIIILAAVIGAIYALCGYVKKESSKISFKEIFDQEDIPIITFINNNKKLNFIIDSGSTISHINKSVVKDLDYSIKEGFFVDDIITPTGRPDKSKVCTMEIKHNMYRFIEDFVLLDLDTAFGDMKDATGIEIHGILGNTFLSKYNFVIDYRSKSIYVK